jgi:hypothetical protein
MVPRLPDGIRCWCLHMALSSEMRVFVERETAEIDCSNRVVGTPRTDRKSIVTETSTFRNRIAELSERSPNGRWIKSVGQVLHSVDIQRTSVATPFRSRKRSRDLIVV